MNVGAVREALAQALAEIPSVQVSPYVLAQPTPPGLQILPPAPVFNFAAGYDEWTFIVQGFVALNSDIGAQRFLDELCAPSGATSVRALLEQDTTLDGLVDSLTVTEQTPGRQVEQPPGNPMLLVEWRCTIYANGGGGG